MTENTTAWIKCSDQLPRLGALILYANISGKVILGYASLYQGDLWFWEYGKPRFRERDIEYWQPIQKLPREKE